MRAPFSQVRARGNVMRGRIMVHAPSGKRRPRVLLRDAPVHEGACAVGATGSGRASWCMHTSASVTRGLFGIMHARGSDPRALLTLPGARMMGEEPSGKLGV